MAAWRRFSPLFFLIGTVLIAACTSPQGTQVTATKPAEQQQSGPGDKKEAIAPAPPTPATRFPGPGTTPDSNRLPEPADNVEQLPGQLPEQKHAMAPQEKPVTRQKQRQATPSIPSIKQQVTPDNSVEPARAPFTGIVTGKIRLLGKGGAAIDSSGVVINLEPMGKIDMPQQAARDHVIRMEDKTYTPGVLSMRTNDTLSFVNGDKIKHNVFSSSGNNTFDLGTYGTGKTRTVKLGSSGIVKVYCNIHPEMATFVNVSDYDLATLTGVDGSFEIHSVPPGRYKVRVWHVRGEMERDLTVEPGVPAKLELILDTSSYRQVPHKNKYGEDYKQKPALFEDEFY